MCERSEPWDHLISGSQLLDLYEQAIDLFGGGRSAPKQGCIEQSMGSAYSAELYVTSEVSREGLCFAGYLLFYLASNHCFLDGNKRIAWIAAMHVLLTLGLTVDAEEDEAEEFCLRVADGAIRDGAEVVRWLGERLVQIS